MINPDLVLYQNYTSLPNHLVTQLIQKADHQKQCLSEVELVLGSWLEKYNIPFQFKKYGWKHKLPYIADLYLPNFHVVIQISKQEPTTDELERDRKLKLAYKHFAVCRFAENEILDDPERVVKKIIYQPSIAYRNAMKGVWTPQSWQNSKNYIKTGGKCFINNPTIEQALEKLKKGYWIQREPWVS